MRLKIKKSCKPICLIIRFYKPVSLNEIVRINDKKNIGYDKIFYDKYDFIILTLFRKSLQGYGTFVESY